MVLSFNWIENPLQLMGVGDSNIITQPNVTFGYSSIYVFFFYFLSLEMKKKEKMYSSFIVLIVRKDRFFSISSIVLELVRIMLSLASSPGSESFTTEDHVMRVEIIGSISKSPLISSSTTAVLPFPSVQVVYI